MRSLSMSRSKMFIPEPIADSGPDIPVLETEDLPSEEDWALMKSLSFDQADVRDIDLDIDQLAQLTVGRPDFD